MKSIFRHGNQLNEQAVWRVSKLYEFPDYVKTAAPEDAFPLDTQQLPANVFGDASTRSFVMHTKAACWLAAVDFEEQRNRLSPQHAQRIESTINKAAAAWGILPDVTQVRNVAATLRQTSLEKLADSQFALVRRYDDRVERQYPLRNAAEVAVAAQWFRKYAAEFALRDRRKIAQRIVERRDDTNAAVDDDTREFLDKLAGYGVPDCQQLGAAVAQRSRLISNPEMQRELAKVAGLLFSATDGQMLGPDVCDSLLTNLDELDRNYRLNTRYGKDLAMPEEACFAVGLHKAAETLREVVQLTSGHIYTKDALATLSLPAITDVFGEDIAAQCATGDGLFVDREKLAEVAMTLPLPDAAMLHTMLQRHGVQELTQKTAAEQPRLTHSDWLALLPAQAAASV